MNPNDVAAELETKPAVSIVYKKIKDGYRKINPAQGWASACPQL